VNKHFLLIYRDFKGVSVQKAWKAKIPSEIRYKATQRADFHSVVSIEEITEEEYNALIVGQRRAQQIIVNRTHKKYA
jgi:hypothetical protein